MNSGQQFQNNFQSSPLLTPVVPATATNEHASALNEEPLPVSFPMQCSFCICEISSLKGTKHLKKKLNAERQTQQQPQQGNHSSMSQTCSSVPGDASLYVNLVDDFVPTCFPVQCPLCICIITDSGTWASHIVGKAHLKKLYDRAHGVPLPTALPVNSGTTVHSQPGTVPVSSLHSGVSSVVLGAGAAFSDSTHSIVGDELSFPEFCEVCGNCRITSAKSWVVHINSRNHIKNLALRATTTAGNSSELVTNLPPSSSAFSTVAGCAFSSGASAVPASSFPNFCDVCKCDITSLISWEVHAQGRKHLKKVSESKSVTATTTSTVTTSTVCADKDWALYKTAYICEVCCKTVQVQNTDQWKLHLQSKEHIAKEKSVTDRLASFSAFLKRQKDSGQTEQQVLKTVQQINMMTRALESLAKHKVDVGLLGTDNNDQNADCGEGLSAQAVTYDGPHYDDDYLDEDEEEGEYEYFDETGNDNHQDQNNLDCVVPVPGFTASDQSLPVSGLTSASAVVQSGDLSCVSGAPASVNAAGGVFSEPKKLGCKPEESSALSSLSSSASVSVSTGLMNFAGQLKQQLQRHAKEIFVIEYKENSFPETTDNMELFVYTVKVGCHCENGDPFAAKARAKQDAAKKMMNHLKRCGYDLEICSLFSQAQSAQGTTIGPSCSTTTASFNCAESANAPVTTKNVAANDDCDSNTASFYDK